MAAPPVTQDSKCPIDCKGSIFFWDESGEIEESGPFPVGTQVKIKNLVNDPLALSGKVGTIAWHVPNGAAVAIEGYPDKVKVENSCIQKELGLIVEIVDEKGSPIHASDASGNMSSGHGAFNPERLKGTVYLKCTCKRKETVDTLKTSFATLLTKWSEVMANAGVRNNPSCACEIDAIEVNGQPLGSRDPFKWAENGASLTVIGTWRVGAPTTAYSASASTNAQGGTSLARKLTLDTTTPQAPVQQGSACCCMQ